MSKFTIPAQNAISVFVSEQGYICIEEVSALGETETVALSPDQVDAVIKLIQTVQPHASTVRERFTGLGRQKTSSDRW